MPINDRNAAMLSGVATLLNTPGRKNYYCSIHILTTLSHCCVSPECSYK